ncbi:hypothetical protein FHS10_000273 [Mucilaginibacter dorajii]|nr:hypothetical protein [Mucilaginibacter dorajii]
MPVFQKSNGGREAGFDFLKLRRPNTPDCLLRMKAASGRMARDLFVFQHQQLLVYIFPICLQALIQ